MKFNKNNWSVRQAIQARVNLEDLAEWGKSKTTLNMPQIKPQSLTKEAKRSIGFRNFYKNSVIHLFLNP